MIELHRTGKHDDATKTQSVIPKFTGRSFKVEIYFNRKALKTSDINFRITPSIACYQLKLLDLTQKYLQEEYHDKKDDISPKFTFADIHRNLKLVLNQS